MSNLPPISSQAATAVPSLFPGRAWQQVLARDSSADGQFFYAVKSTKIYCKPSCASRKPTRKNVTVLPDGSRRGDRRLPRLSPLRT